MVLLMGCHSNPDYVLIIDDNYSVNSELMHILYPNNTVVLSKEKNKYYLRLYKVIDEQFIYQNKVELPKINEKFQIESYQICKGYISYVTINSNGFQRNFRSVKRISFGGTYYALEETYGQFESYIQPNCFGLNNPCFFNRHGDFSGSPYDDYVIQDQYVTSQSLIYNDRFNTDNWATIGNNENSVFYILATYLSGLYLIKIQMVHTQIIYEVTNLDFGVQSAVFFDRKDSIFVVKMNQEYQLLNADLEVYGHGTLSGIFNNHRDYLTSNLNVIETDTNYYIFDNRNLVETVIKTPETNYLHYYIVRQESSYDFITYTFKNNELKLNHHIFLKNT
jgi:hypothetical protein